MSLMLASFADCVDLATEAVGGRVLACSDDFFAEKENLLKDTPAVFDPEAFTERGKLMDGWESRRKRVPGNDWCILRLGVAGVLRGFDIDTSHFLGNHPPFSRVEGLTAADDATGVELAQRQDWVTLLGEVPLKAGSHNLFAAGTFCRVTHLRVWMFPDGGIARLRAYGEPQPALVAREELDLAALTNGGRAIAASDMFFGHKDSLVAPGRAVNMGGGWETRRRRDAGNDWIVVRLAGRGRLLRVVADTHHFKGNFPDRLSLHGLDDAGASAFRIERRADWVTVFGETKAQADAVHEFSGAQLESSGPFTHLRLSVHPCGGVSRLRAWGVLEATPSCDLPGILDAMSAPDRRDALLRCCGSEAWAVGVLAGWPYPDRTALLLAADEVWWTLAPEDWAEAFDHHPRIGADPEALRRRFAATAGWAGSEQAGVQGADEATLTALAAGNLAYEQRFGRVFLICATGLTAAQMLAALRRRLGNTIESERLVAAGEQAKITRLRLLKLEASP